MLVCWEWLSEYVDLNVSDEDMALQFAMSGLNHESTERVGEDIVIDLEVTSNRGDCLGHIGVAREAAVLLNQALKIPAVKLQESSVSTSSLLEIENQFAEGCPEYTGRVIRGVKVGPSPGWLVRRLAAIGVNSVNNIVDVTNYVMMECGQPLHAFDLQQVRQNKIITRRAEKGEKFLAIDHKTYELDPQMVVIADGERAIALGGVMGGADSEVSNSTVDLLIEAARFEPLAIRRAARKLKLHSPASYRFERSPDPHGLDWASQRCCQLILELAGGELAKGLVTAGTPPKARTQIPFRLEQVKRVLGIEVPQERVQEILSQLGCEVSVQGAGFNVLPPTWRLDLTREIDLIEEVARMHGYEKIPENVAVPIGVAAPRPKDVCLDRVRHTLSAYGIDEAMTPSVVGEPLEAAGSVWSHNPPLSIETPLLVGSKLLRRSIFPSLLAARHGNQTQSIRNAQLYEVSPIYLAADSATDLPSEQSTLGIVSQGDLQFAKGLVEEIVSEVVGQNASLKWSSAQHELFSEGTLQQFSVGSQSLGYVGVVCSKVQNAFSLDAPVAAAELSVDALTELLEPVRTAAPVSPFPGIDRDLNFIVDEATTWARISSVCQQHGTSLLQAVEYRETYRDTKKDGAGKKRTLLTLRFRSLERTLTGEEVDAAVSQVIAACTQDLDAKLLG